MALSASSRHRAAGQGFMIDLALATLLFMLVWGFIGAQFDLKYAEAKKSSDVSNMRLKAEQVIDTLVKTPGKPQNWEALPFSSLESPGLAERDRELTEAKLSAFSNFTSSYAGLKDRMGLEGHDFFFAFDGADDVNAGLPPGGPATGVVVERVVTYKGSLGKATIKVYRLE